MHAFQLYSIVNHFWQLSALLIDTADNFVTIPVGLKGGFILIMLITRKIKQTFQLYLLCCTYTPKQWFSFSAFSMSSGKCIHNETQNTVGKGESLATSKCLKLPLRRLCLSKSTVHSVRVSRDSGERLASNPASKLEKGSLVPGAECFLERCIEWEGGISVFPP